MVLQKIKSQDFVLVSFSNLEGDSSPPIGTFTQRKKKIVVQLFALMKCDEKLQSCILFECNDRRRIILRTRIFTRINDYNFSEVRRELTFRASIIVP